MSRLRIKICCISSVEEAETAIELGADALGLVSAMPSGPGVIPEETIAHIAARVPSRVHTFLLTSRTAPEEIVAQVRRCGTDTVQLVAPLGTEDRLRLRARLPGVTVVQVVHVGGEEAIEEAHAATVGTDALLLDSGNPAARELGGTGRTHDWALSARIVAAVPLPVYLAGGLTAANVATAVAQVRPFGVDLCSGVRVGDRLDRSKARQFIAAARQS